MSKKKWLRIFTIKIFTIKGVTMEKESKQTWLSSLSWLLPFVFVLKASGCVPEGEEEIYWYSGAAMKKPAQKIVERYNKQGGNVVLITGGSGQVLHQMMSAQRGDLYSPTSDHFKSVALKKGVAFKAIPLLQVEPVFALAPKVEGIKSFADLLRKKVEIATGNPESMAIGKAWRKIRARMPQKVRTNLRQKVAIEPVNISQTVNYVKTGTVDAGLVFDSIARNNNLEFIRIPGEYNLIQKAHLLPVKYSVASQKRDAFVQFVLNNKNIYKEYGFVPISD